MITPIILSGGSGKRLWPLSRELYPKQFHNIIKGETLFQRTIKRVPLASYEPIIICNENHRFIVAEQLRQIDTKVNSIILEPIGKNTAPAIALGCLRAMEKSEDSIVLVMSSDHLVDNNKKFSNAISIASEEAKKGSLVCLGIKPNKPSTGYGYIEIDRSAKLDKNIALEIKNFYEKPTKERAEDFIKSGDFFWNSGIFIFSAKIFLRELQKLNKKIFNSCKLSYENKSIDSDFLRIDKSSFDKCPNISVDYAVMEKTDKSKMVMLDSRWSDVGTWDSIYDSMEKDKDGNILYGDIEHSNVNNSLCYSQDKLVALIGISNLIVINTSDAILISEKNKENELKELVNTLETSNRKEAEVHTKAYRPWGYYISLKEDVNYHIKKIVLYPDSRISLQKHTSRSEHWVVLKGKATVFRDNTEFELNENESTFIPENMLHRLTNNTGYDLEIIEIQTGDYFGEDDIERFDDDYLRK